MNNVGNHLIRAHGVIFSGLFGIFTVWTFLITNSGLSEGAGHARYVLQTTLGTISGPMTGAIARNFQSCCLHASLQLAGYCAPVLAIGAVAQFVGTPGGKRLRALRLVLWTLGWATWFAGGIVSFLHALS